MGWEVGQSLAGPRLRRSSPQGCSDNRKLLMVLYLKGPDEQGWGN